ncbi:MAG TPA: TldD/PmbA family protein [Acidimicrobiales bacterium]|jgi:PmbA protein|nr:TldD/PmbA family protein [Acidimicrobiales bacterium]
MSELPELAEGVLGRARTGEEVEVYVARSRETEIKAYDGDVESLSSAASAGIAVRVVVDGRQGFAYTGALDSAALTETLEEARDNARFAGVDEHNGMASPDGVAPPELVVDVGKLAGTPVDRKVELALELERAARSADPAIRGVDTAMYGDEVVFAAVATTTGVRAESEAAVCYLATYVMAGEGAQTQTAGWYGVGRSVDELDVDSVADGAVSRAVRMLGARQPASRRLTVVLEPFVTAQFLSLIGSTLTGEAVLKGYSPFGDRVGEQIGASVVTLVEDPTDPDAFGASRFDAEGLAARRVPLVAGGVLQGFVHNSYTGRRSGRGSTGSASRAALAAPVGVGCRALALTPGTMSQAELVASVGDGLLVQDVKGLHSGVNPISGDFSAGAEGLIIRDGVLAEPVREITIASTLQRMLQDVVAIGGDVAHLPMSASGMSLAVGDVTMSGK